MNISQSSIYFITFCWLIILAKPTRKMVIIKQDNVKNIDKMLTTNEVKPSNTVRRQNAYCDYLYEDCESEQFEYVEVVTKKKHKMTFNNKQEHGYIEKEKLNQQVKDSLEDIKSLDDMIHLNDKNNFPGPFDDHFEDRDEKDSTTSTIIWYYFGKPSVSPKLPDEIKLCNDESRCRLPFQTLTTYPTTYSYSY